jgi:hypothetical protein
MYTIIAHTERNYQYLPVRYRFILKTFNKKVPSHQVPVALIEKVTIVRNKHKLYKFLLITNQSKSYGNLK